MKKILLSAVAMFAFTGVTTAQETLFDGLKKLDGLKFIEYNQASSIEGQDGHYQPTGLRSDTVTFKVNKLPSGTPIEVVSTTLGGTEKLLVNIVTHNNVDHFTYITRVYSKTGSTRSTFVVIDSMIIVLDGPNGDGSYKSIGGVYLPVIAEKAQEGSGKKKEKLTMKEKMAALKAGVKSAYGVGDGDGAGINGNRIYMNFVNTNIDSLVASYTKFMLAKQSGCSASKEAASEAEIQMARDAWDQEIADSWDTEEGRRIKANMSGHSDENSYKLRNDSGSDIDIIVNGNVSHIRAGGHSSNISCTNNVYYAVNGSQGGLIAKGTTSCGDTFSVR